MKKKIILALALLAAVVATVAAPSFAALFTSHGPETHGSFVCNFCKGTGRSYGPQGPGTGPFKCTFCKGTGFQGGY